MDFYRQCLEKLMDKKSGTVKTKKMKAYGTLARSPEK